jgi:hypothetical protein
MWKFIQKKKIAQALKKQREPRFLPLAQITDVALIVNYSQMEEIKPIVENMQQSGKTVDVYLIFASRSVQKNPHLKEKLLPECQMIDSSGFSPFGEPNEVIRKQFLRKKFDVIIDLDGLDDRWTYLFLLHPCAFRVGVRSLDFSLYDFCILKEERHTLMDVYSQMKFFLGNIRPSINNS